MKQIELRLRWLVPVVLFFSLWVNFSIANASKLDVDQFAPIILRSTRLANYGQDPADMVFPAVDPQLLDQVLQDQAGQGFISTETSQTTPTPSLTPTPSPTLRPGVPTYTPQPSTTISSPGLLLVPAVLETVEDVANQLLPDVGEILSDVTTPLTEIVPQVTLPVQIPDLLPTTCVTAFGIRVCTP